MQGIGSHRRFFDRIHHSLTSTALLLGAFIVGSNAQAQQPSNPPSSHGRAEAPATTPHLGTPTALRELVREAEQQNPQLAASFHAWQAARNAPAQVSALPETQVFVQQFAVGSPRPFSGYSNSDFAYIGFGASQDFPYPGKRPLRAQVAQYEAHAMEAQTDSVRRTLIGNLKLTYFRLAYIPQTLEVLERNDDVLRQVEQAAEARYRVGQGNQQDVLKAQLQHTKILQEIAHHHEQEGMLEAQLKQLVGRAQDSADIDTETLTRRRLSYSAADLLQKVREQNPDVRSKQAAIQAQTTQVELAHKNSRPDFNLAYTYERTGSQSRDYYMGTFGIRLPNRGRQKAELAEAQQKQQQARRELDSELQRVLSEVQQQYVQAKTSEERLEIYEEGLVPQSQATFRSALAAYQSNRQDFGSLLSSFLDVLNLDLEYRSEIADHESALAQLESLTGVEIP